MCFIKCYKTCILIKGNTKIYIPCRNYPLITELQTTCQQADHASLVYILIHMIPAILCCWELCPASPARMGDERWTRDSNWPKFKLLVSSEYAADFDIRKKGDNPTENHLWKNHKKFKVCACLTISFFTYYFYFSYTSLLCVTISFQFHISVLSEDHLIQ